MPPSCFGALLSHTDTGKCIACDELYPCHQASNANALADVSKKVNEIRDERIRQKLRGF